MDLLETLRQYHDSGACPMHMPGHKRVDLGGPLPWGLEHIARGTLPQIGRASCRERV